MEEEDNNYPLSTSVFSSLFFTPFFRNETILQTRDIIPSVRFGKPITGLVECFKRMGQDGVSGHWRSGIAVFWYSFISENIRLLRDANLSIFEFEIDQNSSEQRKLVYKIWNTIGKMTIPKTESQSDIDKPTKNPFSLPGVPLTLLSLGGQLLLQPLEVIRIRMACDLGAKRTREFSGFMNAIKSTVKLGGIGALYRAYLPFSLYSIISKNSPFANEEKKDLPIYEKFGRQFVVDFAVYPFYTIGSRMVISMGTPLVKYKGMIDCARSTYQQFGLRGFYRGFQVTLLVYTIFAGLETALNKTPSTN